MPPPEFDSKGRITGQSAAALARPYTAEAIATLVGVMRDPDSPVEQKRGAANDLLSRAWGKPKETVELLESPDQAATRAAMVGLTGEDLKDLLRALRAVDVTPPGPRAPAGARSDPDPRGDPPAVPIDVPALPSGETTAPPPPEGDRGAEDASADG